MKVAITQKLLRTFNNYPYRWGIVILVVTRLWKGWGETPMLRWATGGGRGGGQPFRTALNRAQNTPVNPVVDARACYHASLAPLYIADSITCFTDYDRRRFFLVRFIFLIEQCFWKSTTRVLWSKKNKWFREISDECVECTWLLLFVSDTPLFPQEMTSW